MWDERVAAKMITYRDAVYYAQKRAPKGIAAAYVLTGKDSLASELNEQAYREVLFKPRAGVQVQQQDLSTTVAGVKLDMPLILSSVGGLRGAHRDGELAATHAAGEFGAMQFLSGMTTTPVEDVMKEAKGPVFQQVYYVDSRDATAAILERAAAAGVHGLVMIMDSAAVSTGPESSPKERPYLPTKVGFKEAVKFLPQIWNRPAWAMDFLLNGLNAPAAQYALDEQGKPRSYFDATSRLMNETPTFDDLPWVREYWDGPLILKGILRPDDARRAVDVGADAIVVSNHGGFMLDSSMPTLRALPGIAAAVGDQIDVLVDGGIRRGSDIVKAMALGAKAVGIGRAYTHALMAAGEPGVKRMVAILQQQMISTLRFLGVNRASEIDSSYLDISPSWSRLALEDIKHAGIESQAHV